MLWSDLPAALVERARVGRIDAHREHCLFSDTARTILTTRRPGEQTLYGQKVPERGIQVWRPIQSPRPLSRESSAIYLARADADRMLSVSISATSNRLHEEGWQVRRCRWHGARGSRHRHGTFERMPRAAGNGTHARVVFDSVDSFQIQLKESMDEEDAQYSDEDDADPEPTSGDDAE